jgi:hypothetical protein
MDSKISRFSILPAVRGPIYGSSMGDKSLPELCIAAELRMLEPDQVKSKSRTYRSRWWMTKASASLISCCRPNEYAIVHATIRGRFFAGQEIADPRGKRWGGYGHMGCCSLLVIEQVVAVDPHDRDDLDYESFVDVPDVDKLKCGYQDLMDLRPYRDMINAQGLPRQMKGNGPLRTLGV